MSQHPYTREYFEGRGYVGLYRDFVCHYTTAKVVLERKPESVLEVGGSRGYICKLLQNAGVKVTCMDISEHCFHTRAIDDFVLHDATVAPWRFKDKSFDLCFSIAFLEHIPESKVNDTIREMVRVSKRGLHGITFSIAPNDVDETHKQGTIKPKEWWIQKFSESAPDYPVEIMDKEDMEKGPVTFPPSDGLEKIDVGSFLDMFHYGWQNWDAQDLSTWALQNGYVFKQVDATKQFPKPDSSTDIVLASHFIEHLTRGEGETFLKECFRVLKPNGLLRLAIPDSKLLAKKYLKGEIFEYRHVNIGVEKAPDEAEAFFHLLLAGHKTIYDLNSLEATLKKCGFTNIKEMAPFKSQSEAVENQTIPSYPTLSCYVEASPKKEAYVPTATKGKLRIGMVSSPFFGVPPKGYSGLEMVVWDLCCALAKMGHEVTLFAPKGSQAPLNGKLVETGEPAQSVKVDWLKAERDNYEIIKNQLGGLDIIHGHGWFGFEYLAKTRNPQLKVCHTHHGGLSLDWWSRSKPPFKLNLIGISQWMQTVYRSQGFESRFVYNGVDLDKYVYHKRKGDRLMFLGRISRIKAPHTAIEVAKKAGIGLDVVGGTSFVDDPSYVEQVRSMCDGKQTVFVGEVDHETKLKYLQKAKALLVPSRFGEPFGLISVEAMAVGTPVIALNDGALSEVVKEGGIMCNDSESMVYAVKQVGGILPKDCRTNAGRFSRERMAENYLQKYYEVLSGNEW